VAGKSGGKIKARYIFLGILIFNVEAKQINLVFRGG